MLTMLLSCRAARVVSTSCVSALSRVMQHSSSASAVTSESSLVLPPVSCVTVPFRGTSLHVGYVDVGSQDGPVVVALHGAPGGVQDFAELYGPLTDKGIRVVVPEFPGYGRTTVENAADAAFDESTEARATLVHNFLTAIGINSVTTVLGHSMGVASAFHLAANYDYCKSLVYLNGIGFSPQRSISPYWMTCLYARLLDNTWTEPILKSLLSFAYTLKGYNSNALGAGMKTGVVSASRIGFDKLQANASRIRDKGLPIFLSFTQNDRLVEWKFPMEVVKHFGTPDESISWVDSNEQVVKGPNIDDVPVSFPWAMIFERGGHFVHRSHHAMISQRITSFVERVVARESKQRS